MIKIVLGVIRVIRHDGVAMTWDDIEPNWKTREVTKHITDLGFDVLKGDSNDDTYSLFEYYLEFATSEEAAIFKLSHL